MLQLLNINKNYGNNEVLKNLSLNIKKGELLGLIGPNGAGKTTLFNCILSNLDYQGKIIINEMLNSEYLKINRNQIVYLPEELFIYNFLTGMEFVNFILNMHNISFRKVEDKVLLLFELFGLTEYKDQLMKSYSFGMKRKVCLAAALVQSPELMILDEPVFGVDASSIIIFKKLLKQLSQKGVTIIMSTHIIDVIKNLCDSVAILFDKRIVVHEKIQKTGIDEIERKYLELVGADVDSLIDEFSS